MPDPARTAAVVLAAGAGSRFGSTKLLAPLEGRPILEHVLGSVAEAGLAETVVVLGHAADAIEAAVTWRGERIVRNPNPEAGLASSLQTGLAALGREIEAAVIVLGDQPLVRSEVIVALLAAEVPDGRAIVVARYAEGGGPNPALLLRAAWPLAGELIGDRGMGPLIAIRPELVVEIAVAGANPDIDTPADLALVAWGARVRANRDQVERIREVPDGDFYASTTGLFEADPRRSDAEDPTLAALRALARPSEQWLDIGAGAGRYALPLALALGAAGEVVALDPSPAMLGALHDGMRRHAIANVRPIEGRWPLNPAEAPALSADVALIAHVGYDIERIGPFLAAMEGAATRLCVAVMMERTPASIAEPFWPPVHGESRIPLPALPDFVRILRALGRIPDVRMVERGARSFPDRAAALGFLRRQTWVAPDGPKDRILRATLDDRLVAQPDGSVVLRDVVDLAIGLVTWEPP
jgi:CTP:molybdopterin cytidylyltransferase MocA/SAM-dependent methyltransferase